MPLLLVIGPALMPGLLARDFFVSELGCGGRRSPAPTRTRMFGSINAA